MKKANHLSLFIVGMCVVAGFSAKAQQGGRPETQAQQLRRMLQSQDPQSKDSLRSILATLAASSKESDMEQAARFYYQLNEKKTSDSIIAVLPVKFPHGMAVRNKEEQALYNEKDPVKKEQAYLAWEKKFPPAAYPDVEHDHIVYDYARIGLAVAYAEQKNVKKAELWIGKLEEDFYKGNGYGGLAQTFDKNNDLLMAEKYYKMAMLSAQKYYNDSLSKDNAVLFAGSGYPGLMTTYTHTLVKEKKYAEALPWAKKAMTLSKEPSPSLAFTYALLLKHQAQYSEAFNTLEPVIKEGQATQEMVDTFKVLYVKTKGSDAGYAAYSEAIHKGFLENLHKRLTKEEMNQSAIDFTLTDVNGKQVSLADYKGKIVVLDFWATWCGPCKASFPAMKMAQDKFQSDGSVQFLFIHTWEKDTSAAAATAAAKAYVDDNHYPFEVLMDLKDKETGSNKVVESYKVNGIPTKFIIDRNGKIRFRLTGFSGGNEAAVEELSMMIDMAQKPA